MDTRIRSRRGTCAGRLAAAAAAALLTTGAWAAGTAGEPGSSNRSGAAVNCEQRSASTDPAACRQEAGAAAQAQRQGDLTGAQQPLDQNAMARCSALPAGEQDACRARIAGGGRSTTSGSVEGGGILREHRETVTAPAGSVSGGAPAAGTGAGATGSAASGGSGTAGGASGSTGSGGSTAR